MSPSTATHGERNPSRPHGLSLGWKIPLLMTGLLAMGLAAMLAVTYATLSRRAELIVRDRLTHAVAEVAGTVRPSLEPLAAALRRTAADPAVQRSVGRRPYFVEDRAAAERLLEGLRSPRDTAFTAELWDARGRTVLRAGRRVAAAQRPPGPGRAAGDSVWFGPISPEGRPRMWVAAPVRYGSDHAGWVAVVRGVGGPAGATRMLRQLTREELSLYVRNADGSAWVSSPSVRVPPPPGRDSTDAGWMHKRPGVGPLVVSEAAVAGTPWVMGLEVPLASILARPRRTIRLLLQLSALLLAAGILFSAWLSRRITGPIAALTHAAEQVATGTYHAPVRAGGDEIGRLVTSFDAMARQVEAARRALEQRADEAQRAREAAELANQSKTQFLSAMSHELRTPLNAIGGYAQLLEMGLHGPVTGEQREVLGRIERSQAHLLALIEDLLNFAQLEAGRVRYAEEEVELAETVAELEGLVVPQAAARRVRLGFPARRPGIHARADRDKVRQVALNLVVNAIKFTPEGGEVAVDYTAEDDRVSLRVRDTGVGIPTEDLERIFQPFEQGARAGGRSAEGVGLGLAISRELARGMGGEVTVASAPGAGSTFTLTLPRAEGGDGQR